MYPQIAALADITDYHARAGFSLAVQEYRTGDFPSEFLTRSYGQTSTQRCIALSLLSLRAASRLGSSLYPPIPVAPRLQSLLHTLPNNLQPAGLTE